MKIRRFKPTDADFCFKTRSNAFILKFINEIGAKAVAACVNAYMPADYINMAKDVEFFIVKNHHKAVGFFTIKRLNKNSAELPLIYLDLDALKIGMGSTCIRFMEKWIASNWKEVKTFIVDTIIPEYNAGFYKRVGFKSVKQVYCHFPGMKIEALRLCKNLTVKKIQDTDLGK